MNKLFSIFCISVLSLAVVSCSDFWEPESDDMINGEDYIANNTEMYTGFLGIMTKLQKAGDKEILLTEPRGEFIEPTATSSPEIIALYNYSSDLQNNPYADPAEWYELVIACNDYLAKMKEYGKLPGVDETKYEPLVASAVCVKMWAYKTIGEIYGKAYWFDDPITKVSDIQNASNFQLMTMKEIAEKCIELCRDGYEGISLNQTISWKDWLDPDTETANSQYRRWNTMVPAYAGIYAECCLWKAAFMDAAGEDATAYYKEVADMMLREINVYVNSSSTSGNPPYWLPSVAAGAKFGRIWDWKEPYGQETVSAIIYDYSKNQTNTLLKHFSNEFPNKYLMKPSEAGMNRFTDDTFNPGSFKDKRFGVTVGTSKGEKYVAKFRPVGSSYRANAYEDDVHIYTYRATQYHMMLAEALNHLKRFEAMNGVLNVGVKVDNFVADTPEWEGFTRNWTKDAEWGSRSYPSSGVRGIYELFARDLKKDIYTLGDLTSTLRYNDLALLDEIMLEFACEGKVYPAMNRMAVRYNDPSIVADRVCPKYEATGMADEIRGKIMNGGYWVNYDLKLNTDNSSLNCGELF